MSFIFPEHDFSALSLEDLLAAREIFHVQLADKKNVIATALGRYLIRRSDPWPKRKQNAEQIKTPRKKKDKRTLANSEIRPYSCPCILVFVSQWEDPANFGKAGLDYDDMVPRSVALPSGKRVPVCVVQASLEPVSSLESVEPALPSTQVGGGYPLVAVVQKREHQASVGCLVTDGHLTYALTSRHVTGAAGEAIYSRFIGQKKLERVGVSSGKQLGRVRFRDIYPDWVGEHTYCNLDVGLLAVDDINRWTPSIYKIGQLGSMVDISNGSVLFRLLGCIVSAYGAAGEKMQGQVQGLFYRYKSLGGFDYVADFLIGPKPGERLTTQPGDSGTLWVLNSDNDEPPAPLALQWGGHVFTEGELARTRSPYALATALSTVCNLLEVTVVRDWGLDRPEFWGEMGHYTIGAKACELVTDPKLSDLMMANQIRIGFRDSVLKEPDKYRIHDAHYRYVPLADVADDVWRMSRVGGSHPGINDDGNNHFADMDQQATSGPYHNKTLMDLFDADPSSVDPDIWLEFYDAVGESKPGALPFRVWQGFKEMVDALNEPGGLNLLRYVCVAGCMAHYVGDACQPLHVSRLHHGFPPVHKGTVAAKVHSVYETEMLNKHAADVVEGLNQRIQQWNQSLRDDIIDGKGAAVRVVELMKNTFTAIPPETLVKAYNKETKPAARLSRLWDDFGEATMDCMFAGCVCMAEIWQSAWKQGPATLSTLPSADLRMLSRDALSGLYRKSSFYESVGLANMKPLLGL